MQPIPFYTVRKRSIWAPVSGAPYWISAMGEVRSIERYVHGRDGRRMRVPGRTLKPQLNKDTGYYSVSIYANGEKRYVTIHTLVAEAFIAPRPDGMDVNHMDGDKRNNWIGNLEYVTRSGNCRHARDTGLVNRKLNVEMAQAIRDSVANGATYSEMADRFGVTNAMVGYIVRGQSWNTQASA